MLKKNYVQEEPPDGTNRRFYRITPVGEKLIQQELEMIGKLT
jgi:DNA-binding PadR family transcriptional regulator